MSAEILFTAVTQPHAQCLGNFFALLMSERFVQRHRFRSFATTSRVVVRIPLHTRTANEPRRFFDYIRARDGLVAGFFLGRHAMH